MSVVDDRGSTPCALSSHVRIAGESGLAVLCLIMWLVLAGTAQARPGFHPALPQANAQATPGPIIDVRSTPDSGSAAGNPQQKQSRPVIAPYQAAERARERFGGRVLNVVLEHGPSGPYYRVKILRHGRVRVVDIDARR